MLESIFNKSTPQRHNIMNILTKKYPIKKKRGKENEKENTMSIPKYIYQTWHTKELPHHMKKCVDELKRANPEFTHCLYDDNDCRKFIAENFSKQVL